MPVEPRAAYRVQLRPGFGLDAGAQIAPYLAKLGISHFFASPYLQAAPGSQHGYDIVDPTRVNAELGGEDAHARLCAALAAHGLAQMLDIVPNHMAIAGRENAWWWDVLENGPSSRYASYFDIDWDPPERRLTTKVLVPVLGDHYGRVLEDGDIRLERDGGTFRIRYFDHCFPVDPRTYDVVLGMVGDEDNPAHWETWTSPVITIALILLLNAALGGGMSSRLFQEVREKRGLAYSVYSFHTQYADTGMFGVGVGCLPSLAAPARDQGQAMDPDASRVRRDRGRCNPTGNRIRAA